MSSTKRKAETLVTRNKKHRTPVQRTLRLSAFLVVGMALTVLVGFGALRWYNTRLWDEQLRLHREAGLPTTVEDLEAMYPPIPDEQNGAIEFLAAADAAASMVWDEPLMDRLPIAGQVQVDGNRTLYTGDQIAAMREYLSLNADALNLLHAGAAKPDAWYEQDFENIHSGAFLTKLGKMRSLARIAAVAVAVAAHDGDGDRVVEEARAGFALARSLQRIPDATPLMVSRALAGIVTQEFERAMRLGALEDRHLAALEAELASLGDYRLMRRGIKKWGADVVQSADSSMYSVLLGQEFASRVTPGIDVSKRVEESLETIGEFLVSASSFSRGITAASLQALRTWLDTYDMSPENVDAYIEQERNDHPYETFLLTLIIPETSWMHPARHMMSQNYIDLMRARLQIERYRLRHGDWPDTLNDLVPEFADAVPLDVWDNTPLIYHRQGAGFRLYALGRDRDDDNGHGGWNDSDIAMNVLEKAD